MDLPDKELDKKIRSIFLNMHNGMFPSNVKLFEKFVDENTEVAPWNEIDPDKSVYTEEFQGFKLVKMIKRLIIIAPDPDDVPAFKNTSFGSGKGKPALARFDKGFINLSGNKKNYLIFNVKDQLASTPDDRAAFNTTQFMNRMPSTLVSSMMPYVDIEFEYGNPPGSLKSDFKNKNEKPPGLLRYLLQGNELGSFDRLILQNSTIFPPTDSTANIRSYSGMETFLKPVTLADPNSSGPDSLDPFAPFLSVDSFTVTNVSQGSGTGDLQRKRGSLNITLHDRSRLPEIADLVRPEYISQINVWVTYGWRCNKYGTEGAVSENDVYEKYSDFINGNFLVKDCFYVSNSSFSFEGNGIKISLTLTCRGGTESEYQSIDVALLEDAPLLRSEDLSKNGAKASPNLQRIQNIATLLDRLRAEEKGILDSLERSKKNTSILGSDIIHNLDDYPNYAAIDKKELSSKLEEIENKLKVSLGDEFKSQGQQFMKDLRELLQQNQQNNNNYTKETELYEGLTSRVQKVFKKLKEKNDVFMISGWAQQTGAAYAVPDKIKAAGVPLTLNNAKIPVNNFMSYGHIFSSIVVGAALKTPNVREVQVLFYPMNPTFKNNDPHYKEPQNFNISSFPLETAVFLDKYRRMEMQTGLKNNLKVGHIITILKQMVEDPAAIPYDLRQYLEPYDAERKETDKKDGPSWQKTLNAEGKLAKARYEETIIKPEISVEIESYMIDTGEITGVLNNGSVDLLTHFEKTAADYRRTGDGLGLGLRFIVSDKSRGRSQFNEKGLLQQIKQSKSEDRGKLLDQTLNEINSSLERLKILSGDQNNGSSVIMMDPQQVYNDKTKSTGAQLNKDPSARATVLSEYVKLILNGGVSQHPPMAIFNSPSTRFVKELISMGYPTIVYGSQGSVIKTISGGSKINPLIGASNMYESTTKPGQPLASSGKNGIPVQVQPGEINVTCLGCPLVRYGQFFFIDMGTNTQTDNVYIATGVTHNFTPGAFETQIKFSPYNRYNALQGPREIIDLLDQVQQYQN